MKRKAGIATFLFLSIIFFVCACATERGRNGNETGTGVATDGIGTGIADVSDGRDDYVERYVVTVNVSVEMQAPLGALEGGTETEYLGSGKAFCFKKHLLETPQDSYDEVIVTNSAGEKHSVTWSFEDQIWVVGYAANGGFLACKIKWPEEGELYQYFMEAYQEDGTLIKSVPLEFMASSGLEEPKAVASDREGNIHVVRKDGQGSTRYFVASPDGELLVEKDLAGDSLWQFLVQSDGRIACDVAEPLLVGESHQRHEIKLADVHTGAWETVVTYDWFASPVFQGAMNFWGEDQFVLANREGVFLCDRSLRSETVYLWKKHDIEVNSVQSVFAGGDGTISVLLRDGDGKRFILLQPGTDRKDRLEVELAVMAAEKNKYRDVAYEFNQNHPDCRIVLKEDYDETELLTKLMAGRGPVLMDANLIGFEEQKKLWEPLGPVFEKWAIADQLNPAAVEMGSLDGSLYGIITDFSLETMVTAQGKKGWDYEAYLQCLEQNHHLKALVDNVSGADKTTIATYVFDHGTQDSFYVDAESQSPKFDTEAFRKLLRSIEQYGPTEELISPGIGVKEGEVLTNVVYVRKPEDLVFYRTVYGDGADFAGYPGKFGGKHFLRSGSVLAVRKSASDQEKEVAFEFLKMLLSYEMQQAMMQDVNFALSARKDLLEEQIYAVKKGKEIRIFGFEEKELSVEPDPEKNGNELKALLDKAIPYWNSERDYKNILQQEFDAFFAGEIGEEMLIDHLTNRVGLYLKENR